MPTATVHSSRASRFRQPVGEFHDGLSLPPNSSKSHGIRGAILVQVTGRQPQRDLAHTCATGRKPAWNSKLKQLDIPGPTVALDYSTRFNCAPAMGANHGSDWFAPESHRKVSRPACARCRDRVGECLNHDTITK